MTEFTTSSGTALYCIEKIVTGYTFVREEDYLVYFFLRTLFVQVIRNLAYYFSYSNTHSNKYEFRNLSIKSPKKEHFECSNKTHNVFGFEIT